MEVRLLSEEKNSGKLSFIVKDTNSFFVNTLRRLIVEEVPTLAIEDVEFRDNSSALYDEVVAHRLGLIPIETDLKGYTLPAKCTCKGEGCAKCTLKMTLNASKVGYVYAEEIKSKDPKCKPVYAKMPITKLIKGQAIEFEATAVLGKGKEHIKWSPGLVYYKGVPELKQTNDSNVKAAMTACNGLIKDSGDKLEIADLNKWTEACDQMCEENKINVIYSDTDFIINIESWGQLEPKEMVKEAVEQLKEKTSEFTDLLKELK